MEQTSYFKHLRLIDYLHLILSRKYKNSFYVNPPPPPFKRLRPKSNTQPSLIFFF